MNGIVARFKKDIPSACQTSKCDKDGCSVSLKDAPRFRAIVDMDCKELTIRGSRCDYLFVVEDQGHTWVVPIELKSGGIKVPKVREQLQGGAKFAQRLLVKGDQFNFVPVLAHGKPIHPLDLDRLRAIRINLQGKRQQPRLIRCGDRLPMF